MWPMLKIIFQSFWIWIKFILTSGILLIINIAKDKRFLVGVCRSFILQYHKLCQYLHHNKNVLINIVKHIFQIIKHFTPEYNKSLLLANSSRASTSSLLGLTVVEWLGGIWSWHYTGDLRGRGDQILSTAQLLMIRFLFLMTGCALFLDLYVEWNCWLTEALQFIVLGPLYLETTGHM